MKKTLLIAAVAMTSAVAMADTDGATYEPVNGFTCTNDWIIDRFHTGDEAFQALSFNQVSTDIEVSAASPNNARTCTFWDDEKGVIGAAGKTYLIVAWSCIGNAGEYPTLVYYDIENGKEAKFQRLKQNGENAVIWRGANNVGVDAAGNLYVSGLQIDFVKIPEGGEPTFNQYPIYLVDPATGDLSEVASLQYAEDDADATLNGRLDYIAVDGDLTGKTACCTVIAGLTKTTQFPIIVGWHREQGGEWAPYFEEGTMATLKIDIAANPDLTVPKAAKSFGDGCSAEIMKSDDYAADMFYIDGNATFFSLYDKTGDLVEGWNSEGVVTADGPKEAGVNGVKEITFGGKHFIIYALNQYIAPTFCQLRIAEMGGENNDMLAGCKAYFDVPAQGTGTSLGFGKQSDQGNRIAGICMKVIKDANGVEALKLGSFKTNNGMAVYTIAAPGYNAGVNDVISDADANAPVEYFNLQGVSVNADNLTPGLYITRQGKTVAKKIVK